MVDRNGARAGVAGRHGTRAGARQTTGPAGPVVGAVGAADESEHDHRRPVGADAAEQCRQRGLPSRGRRPQTPGDTVGGRRGRGRYACHPAGAGLGRLPSGRLPLDPRSAAFPPTARRRRGHGWYRRAARQRPAAHPCVTPVPGADGVRDPAAHRTAPLFHGRRPRVPDGREGGRGHRHRRGRAGVRSGHTPAGRRPASARRDTAGPAGPDPRRDRPPGRGTPGLPRGPHPSRRAVGHRPGARTPVRPPGHHAPRRAQGPPAVARPPRRTRSHTPAGATPVSFTTLPTAPGRDGLRGARGRTRPSGRAVPGRRAGPGRCRPRPGGTPQHARHRQREHPTPAARGDRRHARRRQDHARRALGPPHRPPLPRRTVVRRPARTRHRRHPGHAERGAACLPGRARGSGPGDPGGPGRQDPPVPQHARRTAAADRGRRRSPLRPGTAAAARHPRRPGPRHQPRPARRARPRRRTSTGAGRSEPGRGPRGARPAPRRR